MCVPEKQGAMQLCLLPVAIHSLTPLIVAVSWKKSPPSLHNHSHNSVSLVHNISITYMYIVYRAPQCTGGNTHEHTVWHVHVHLTNLCLERARLSHLPYHLYHDLCPFPSPSLASWVEPPHSNHLAGHCWSLFQTAGMEWESVLEVEPQGPPLLSMEWGGACCRSNGYIVQSTHT